MLKIKLTLYNLKPVLIFLFLVFTFNFGWSATRQVLVINSYDPGFPTFERYAKGLNEVFGSEDVSVAMAYMDSKMFIGEENISSFKERLKYKLSNLNSLDLIITVDDNALNFAIDNQDDMFPGIPIVFWGINDVEFGKEQNKRKGVTGIVEDVSMRDNVELMLKLFPDAETIYTISDITFTAKQDLKKFEELRNEFHKIDLKVLSLEENSYPQLATKLQDLKSTDLILLISTYHDATGASKKFEEGLQFLNRNMECPIFHLWEHGIGQGIFGGKVISHYEQARLAGKIGLQILAGKDINTIPVIDPDNFKFYMFDYNIITKFGIKKSQLPEGSIVINKAPNLWETNWKIVLLVIITIVLQSLLIVALVLMYRFRKKTLKLVSAQKEKYQLLAENTEDVIWTMAPNNEFTFVSQSVERLRGFSAEEVMKQSFHEFMPPSSMQIVVENLEKFWQEYNNGLRPRKPWYLELEQYCANGSTVWTDVVINPIYNEKNEIQYLLGVTRNLTERKRYEDLLKYNENLLRRIVNNIPKSFVAVIEKDLTISFVSGKEYKKDTTNGESKVSVINLTEEQKTEIFGLRNEMIKKNYQSTFEGTDLTFEIVYNDKFYRYRCVKLPDEDLKINKILVFVEDITERKVSDKELEEYRTKLEEMVKARTAELSSKNEELARFNQIFVGREFRIKELRTKLKEYKDKYGIEDGIGE